MKFDEVNENNLDDEFIKVYEQGYNYHKNLNTGFFINKTKEEHLEDIKDKLKTNKLFKIYDNNIFIGILIYQIVNKHYGNVLWISQIVVDEKLRGKGYITKIFDEIKIIAKNEKCVSIALSCWVKNEYANNVYKHLGFKEKTITYEYKI